MSGDLKLAAKLLEEGNTLVVVRDGRTLFSSRMSGITPLMEALDSNVLPGSAVADKVIGRAAAMIAVAGEVTSLYCTVMSQEAVEVLAQAGILYCSQKVVPIILDQRKTRRCPVEAATEFTVIPEKGVNAVRHLLEDLHHGAKIIYTH